MSDRGRKHEEDLLGRLRTAYREISVPDPLAGADDSETQAVCSALRTAYRGLEIPPAPLPKPRSNPFQQGQPRSAFAVSIAAAFLAFLGAGLWRIGGAPAPRENSPVVSEHGLGIVAAVTHDRLELRSGHVRLVLLTNTTADDAVMKTEETR